VVRGVVRSTSTAAPVDGAQVAVAGSRLGAVTDADGVFRIAGVPAGPATLVVRRLGYRTLEQPLLVLAGDSVDVVLRLEPGAFALDTVRAEARAPERARFEQIAQPGIVSITSGALTTIPAVGEADILRTVQLLPGVLARNDFSAGYNVRGGESDQNLVLLDGIPVYNPFHLGGLFGTFLEPTVREITLYTAGFPASYGGRLSSVLDVSSAAEARQGMHGEVNVSMLATSATLGSALPSTRGSWNLAARRTYADQVVGAVTDRVLPYHFRDAQAHGFHLLPFGAVLSATAYDGEDVLDGSFATVNDDEEDGVGGGDFLFQWGNRLAGVTLAMPLGGGATVGFPGDSARFVQRASVSNFRTTLDIGSGSAVFRNRVTEWRLNGELTTRLGPHAIGAGYEYSQHRIYYDAGSPQSTLTFLHLEQNPAAWSLFLEDSWRVSERLLVRPGIRGEHVTGTDWYGISPRVSAKWFLSPDAAITVGAGQYAQWMHALRKEDIPVRIFDFWIGSDQWVDVSTTTQVSGGVERWLGARRFIRLEGFYKQYDRLLEQNPANDTRVRGDEFSELRGGSYGLDLLVRQLETGPLGGWLSYSWGVSSRRDDSTRFAPAQDRRHNLNLVASWRPNPRLAVGARFGYGSGTPYTCIESQVVKRNYNGGTGGWDGETSERQLQPVGGPRNACRFPDYQRLDVSVSRSYQRGRATVTPYLQVINLYNWRNVFTTVTDFTTNPPTEKAISQFPILPTIGVGVEF
jgi:hypothetical protein